MDGLPSVPDHIVPFALVPLRYVAEAKPMENRFVLEGAYLEGWRHRNLRFINPERRSIWGGVNCMGFYSFPDR